MKLHYLKINRGLEHAELIIVSWPTWAEAQYRQSPSAYWCPGPCRGRTASPSSQQWTGTIDRCRVLLSQPAAGLEAGPEPPQYGTADVYGPAARKTAVSRWADDDDEGKEKKTEWLNEEGWTELVRPCARDLLRIQTTSEDHILGEDVCS